MEDNILNRIETISDDKNIRPLDFENYIGQTDIVENLKIAIHGSKLRGHQLDHILLYGSAGLGKTTLSQIIANETQSNIKIITGTSIEKSGDIASLLTTLEDGDFLFIDEIHRIPKIAEETIYSAMEDYKLHITIENGENRAPVTIDLPKFTLIGATTRTGMLTKPMRDRFGMTFRLKYYTSEELSLILQNASIQLNMNIMKDATLYIAENSRNTPRIALRILRRLRDFADYNNIDIITKKETIEGFKILKIYNGGLEDVDILYLNTLTKDKAIGLETIASKINEDISTIKDLIEPYLIETGYVEKTARGRLLTEKGFHIL